MGKFSRKGNVIFSKHAGISSVLKLNEFPEFLCNLSLAVTQIQINPSIRHIWWCFGEMCCCSVWVTEQGVIQITRGVIHTLTHINTWSKVLTQHTQNKFAHRSYMFSALTLDKHQKATVRLRVEERWQENQRKMNRVPDEALERSARSDTVTSFLFSPSMRPSSCLVLFFCLSAELKATAQWGHVLTFHNISHFYWDCLPFFPN